MELTLEQDLKMRQIEDALKSDSVRKEDLITVFIALQHQCFVLTNNIKQLVTQWPNRTTTTEDESLFGISFEIKN
jgi:hypothetical protein